MDNELQKYIESMRQKGMQDDDIRASLTNSYAADDIDIVLKNTSEVKNTRPTAVAAKSPEANQVVDTKLKHSPDLKHFTRKSVQRVGLILVGLYLAFIVLCYISVIDIPAMPAFKNDVKTQTEQQAARLFSDSNYSIVDTTQITGRSTDFGGKQYFRIKLSVSAPSSLTSQQLEVNEIAAGYHDNGSYNDGKGFWCTIHQSDEHSSPSKGDMLTNTWNLTCSKEFGISIFDPFRT